MKKTKDGDYKELYPIKEILEKIVCKHCNKTSRVNIEQTAINMFKKQSSNSYISFDFICCNEHKQKLNKLFIHNVQQAAKDYLKYLVELRELNGK